MTASALVAPAAIQQSSPPSHALWMSHHDAFILSYEKFIHMRNTFMHTSMSFIRNEGSGHRYARLPPSPHTLRCYKAHTQTASWMIAGCVLEQGFLHPQRRLLSFLFATHSHSMQPDAAPQHYLYRQILAPLPFRTLQRPFTPSFQPHLQTRFRAGQAISG